MRLEAADGIARALLYEGYVLYPYRASALKNQRRWTFGSLLPRDYTRACDTGDRHRVVTECLLEGGPGARVEVRVRFLHVTRRTVLELSQPAAELTLEALPPHRRVASLQLGREQLRSWEEALERELCLEPVGLEALARAPWEQELTLPEERELEPLRPRADALAVGALLRERSLLRCGIRVSAEPLGAGHWRLRVEVHNLSPWTAPEHGSPREHALQRGLVSTHTLLGLELEPGAPGGFVSLLEPPAALAGAAAACQNEGTWPVLVGPHGARDTLLSSPIILYDYPQVAPQSPGDLFDATEIDELLTLRIQTLTPAERREAAASDPLTRRMLERAEGLEPSRLSELHGRTLRCEAALAPGRRVRLRPRRGGDAQDLLLRGQLATVEAIEQDAEGRLYLAVTVDADPGRDLGLRGHPGHRFFFRPEELEPLGEEGPV